MLIIRIIMRNILMHIKIHMSRLHFKSLMELFPNKINYF